jgi:integrase
VGYAEKRGDYYRGRYKIGPGKYGTVTDEFGDTRKFRTKREAERAANDKEAEVRTSKKPPKDSRVRFSEFVSRWYATQALAPSTMETYRFAIEVHLLPSFGEMELGAISPKDVLDWEAAERRAGYAENSVQGWRKILHLILADAMTPHYGALIDHNPASRQRGRGRVTSRASRRGVEKVITGPLGALLLAERAALMTGRDDEFVLLTTKYYTGARWGEMTGLERQYVRPDEVRIEWQLYELATGEFVRIPPKDGSRRTIKAAPFLGHLLAGHLGRTSTAACGCHGHAYTFRGAHAARESVRTGPTLVDVARLAEVSTGTVSNVLNHPDRVKADKVARVKAAVAELGFTPGSRGGGVTPHWKRNSFATWVFQPAATGWFPPKAPYEARPVPIVGEPWPGSPVRGRNAGGRATASWLPIAPGLTPHSLRHSLRTLLLELGMPSVLIDLIMGHTDTSVQGNYSHVTPEMWTRLFAALTATWEAALDQRLAMCPRSPVTVLDRLLQERAALREASEQGGRVLPFARVR